MTLTLQLTPELEQQLNEAKEAGLDVDAILKDGIERALAYAKSVAEIEEAIRDMEAGNRLTMQEFQQNGQEFLEWVRTLPREEVKARFKAKYGADLGG
jgi:hypothetical protein